MMPRAAAHLFQEISTDSSHTYNVVMSYVQIYMELIQVPALPNTQLLSEGGYRKRQKCSSTILEDVMLPFTATVYRNSLGRMSPSQQGITPSG